MPIDDPMFTFAILTDTHIRAPEGDLSSPFPVNEKANARARYAVEVIKSNSPELTVHLGDMVHPLPHLPAYGSASREARGILAPLEPNLHFVPGNHDIGDKPAKALPAGPVTAENRKVFEAAFGASRWCFVHNDAVFIALNSSLVNSGLPEEAEQKTWFENSLAEASGRRIFVFSHYPPYIDTPNETEHYDNYSEPGRSWFLDLAANHGVEAVFSGHVHQFFFNVHCGVKLYCLPPTSFTRQDYSELYRVGPTAEFGRDDAGKFGICLIDIDCEGHRLRFAPTDGKQMTNGERPVVAPIRTPNVPIVPHLRHGWFESSLLPYNGPMEEFSRKRARNDYSLLRLWQLGIAIVRTPLADLVDPDSRRRVLDFFAAGIRFSFFCLGFPSADEIRLLRKHRDLVAGLEIVSSDALMQDIGPGLVDILAEVELPVTVGKVTSSVDERGTEKVFAHTVSFGFLWQDHEAVFEAASSFMSPQHRVSLCFQINQDDDPKQMLGEMAEAADRTGVDLVAVLRTADRNPAKPNFDDDRIADRLIAALEVVRQFSNVGIQIDTFEDIDRGYAPRHGLVDRHSNLRPVAQRLIAG